MPETRKNLLFLLLSGFFITNAIMGEMTGGKIIQLGPFALSMGIIPWPVVFLSTDLINEYYGRNTVRRLTFVASGLIVYAFLLLFLGMNVEAAPFSPVSSEAFNTVFGQSMWIIVGSLVAFLLSQLIDVIVFWAIRRKTGSGLLWLRATGSTVVSQLIDTFVVAGIAFLLPGKISFAEYLNMAGTGYLAKLIIAIALTPLIYLGHNLISKYLAGSDGREKTTGDGHL